MVGHVCHIVLESEEEEEVDGSEHHVILEVHGGVVIPTVLYLVIPVMVQETQVVLQVWDLVPTSHIIWVMQVQITHHHIHTVPT